MGKCTKCGKQGGKGKDCTPIFEQVLYPLVSSNILVYLVSCGFHREPPSFLYNRALWLFRHINRFRRRARRFSEGGVCKKWPKVTFWCVTDIQDLAFLFVLLCSLMKSLINRPHSVSRSPSDIAGNKQESPAEARVTRDSSACIKTPDK